MAKRRMRNRQQEATAWPKVLTEDQLRFVSIHDLSKTIGTGRSVQVDFTLAALEKTRGKRLKRILVALRLERQSRLASRRVGLVTGSDGALRLPTDEGNIRDAG